MEIVSVQSRVTWGYVGNAVAVPTAQCFGADIWPIDTVRLLHHPGHGPVEKRITEPLPLANDIRETVRRMNPPAALLLGYLGRADQGAAVLNVLASTPGKQDMPLYFDPAFGDDAEGVYVDPMIVDFAKTAVIGKAHAVLPNRFELSTLSGLAVADLRSALDASRALMALGPSIVLATSIPMPDDRIGNLLTTRDGAWFAAVPRLTLRAKGTGDMLTAAFTACHLSGLSAADALGVSVGAVHLAAELSAGASANELVIPAWIKKGVNAVIPTTVKTLTSKV